MCCLTKWKESSHDVYVHQIITMYLQIAVKRREVKSKGEKERYKHLNAEFQRLVRRDKKALLSDQCKEIEENNRMGKTRDASDRAALARPRPLSRHQFKIYSP